MQPSTPSDSNVPTSHPRDQSSINVAGSYYQKHRTHWYTDGNLIILVEKTAFRVFQSLLTRRSTVMELALTVPEPNQPADTFDGASVVHLGDKAADFGLLLDVILPQTCASAPISTATEWFRLLGLAQIAQRYGLSDVVSQVIALLEEVLPTVQQPHRMKSPVDAVVIIQWARQCGFQQFLPMAFYYLVTGDWKFNAMNVQAIATLSIRDRLRSQQGLIRLQAMVLKLALGRWENSSIGASKPAKGCPNWGLGCWAGYGGQIWPSADDETRWTNLLLHPLEELRMRTDNEVTRRQKLCENCWGDFVVANTGMIARIVKELPKVFTLEMEPFPLGASPASVAK